MQERGAAYKLVDILVGQVHLRRLVIRCREEVQKCSNIPVNTFKVWLVDLGRIEKGNRCRKYASDIMCN